MNCLISPDFYFSDWPVCTNNINNNCIIKHWQQRSHITQILKGGFELALIELLTIGSYKNVLAVLFPYTYVLIQQMATDGIIVLIIVCMNCNSRRKYTGLAQIPSPDIMYSFLSRWFKCTKKDEEKDISPSIFLDDEYHYYKIEEIEEKDDIEQEKGGEMKEGEGEGNGEGNDKREGGERGKTRKRIKVNKDEDEWKGWNDCYYVKVQKETYIRRREIRKKNSIIASIEIVKQIYEICGPLLTCFPYDNIEAIDLTNNLICLSNLDGGEGILEYQVFCLECYKLLTSFSFNHTNNINSNNLFVDKNDIVDYLHFIGNSFFHHHLF